ncbi:dihydroceramide delta(4)-desaturase [Mycena floridula]|nr:dihydroceramide delta(4)-desaturase [Mycena floridula]
MAVDYSLCGGAEVLPPRSSPRTSVQNPELPRNPYALEDTPIDPQASGHYGPVLPETDFLWLMTEEPHRTRRAEIMKRYPKVTTLMGHEPLTKYVVLLVVSIQLLCAYLLRNTPFLSPAFLLTAYIVGGTANQNLFLAIHEITHNLAFRSIWANKSLAVFANLPIGIPYAAAFKGYHMEHHRYLGEDGVDTDLPTKLELVLLNNVLGKVFFATFQILFYALRPGLVRAQTLTKWHLGNLVTQILFDYVLVQTLGWKTLVYFIASSFFAGSLHPCAGHFIAEHYLWDGLEQETYSYYGKLNWVAYNVGYHNEHHDFPAVAWTRLPKLKAMAPEFYDGMPCHESWIMVIINFIRDKEVGLHARAKRRAKAAKE